MDVDMFQGLTFEQIKLPDEASSLREEVRQFVESELAGDYLRNSDFNAGESPGFSHL